MNIVKYLIKINLAKTAVAFFILVCSVQSHNIYASTAVVDAELPKQNVSWDSVGTKDSRQGMPTGNGTYSALVWAERSNDLLLLLGANNFWDENVHLQHPGRIRISFSDPLFAIGKTFTQELKLKESQIIITAGDSSAKYQIKVWADANNPVMHIESNRISGSNDVTMTIAFESLRPWEMDGDTSGLNYYDMLDSPYGTPKKRADIIETIAHGVYWYQRNNESYFDEILNHQGMTASNYSDILTGRTFGGLLIGDGFSASGNTITKTGSSFQASIVLNSEIATVSDWKTSTLSSLPAFSEIETQRTAHENWWDTFWNRSYMFASGTSEAIDLTQKYTVARYLQACASRTPGMPLRFNGSIFTVGKIGGDPDWRPWNSYHAFNQRFAYWGMLASGDFDLMQPHFDLYNNSFQLAKDRVSTWWPGTEGAVWPEVLGLFGQSVGGEYGWDRAGHTVDYIRGDHTRGLYTGNIELAAMMLDYYEYTEDGTFATSKLIPLAKEIVKFYFTKWSVDSTTGKLNMTPVWSGEIDRNLTNPTADISGLHKVVDGLLALPTSLTTTSDRTYWADVKTKIPPIKISSSGRFQTSEDVELGNETNNQNLYPVFPMRSHGYGKADLLTAVNSYTNRRGKNPRDAYRAWRHDGIHAAYLGLTDDAKAQINDSLGRNAEGEWRFTGFAANVIDGDPNVEPAAIGKITFQSMLLHPGEGDQLNLFNAWPAEWDVKFKLHAPKSTVVEGELANSVPNFVVSPANRTSDVVVRTTPAVAFGNETTDAWSPANQNATQLAGDFNGDGIADIGLWEKDNGSIYLRYGNGQGNFTGETFYQWSANSATQHIIADFNGDGKDDIGVWEYGQGSWYIRYNLGNGQFGNETLYVWNAAPTAKVLAGDFNGDGKGDIGVWESSGNWYIRYGNGAGQFSNETHFIWNANPVAQPFFGDFNSDGNDDIGVWDKQQGSWYIRYGNGTGQFTNESLYQWNASPLAEVISGDFNGDAKSDIGVVEKDGTGRNFFVRYKN